MLSCIIYMALIVSHDDHTKKAYFSLETHSMDRVVNMHIGPDDRVHKRLGIGRRERCSIDIRYDEENDELAKRGAHFDWQKWLAFI